MNYNSFLMLVIFFMASSAATRINSTQDDLFINAALKLNELLRASEYDKAATLIREKNVPARVIIGAINNKKEIKALLERKAINLYKLPMPLHLAADPDKSVGLLKFYLDLKKRSYFQNKPAYGVNQLEEVHPIAAQLMGKKSVATTPLAELAMWCTCPQDEAKALKKVALLLEKNADPKKKSTDGTSALNMAEEQFKQTQSNLCKLMLEQMNQASRK